MAMPIQAQISINCVKGGFIVSYPAYVDGVEQPVQIEEVATTVGKAMRIAKVAVNEFSQVVKSKEDDAES